MTIRRWILFIAVTALLLLPIRFVCGKRYVALLYFHSGVVRYRDSFVVWKDVRTGRVLYGKDIQSGWSRWNYKAF